MQLPRFSRLPAHQGLIVLALLLLVSLSIGERNTRLFAADTAVAPLTVQFSLPTGVYAQDINVQLETPDPRAQILFTVDGSLPVPGRAAIYSRPLHFRSEPASVITIRARAVSPAGEMGPVVNTPYFLGIEATIPILSLTADPDDLQDPERGLLTNPTERGREWERPVAVTYLDKNGHVDFQIPAGLRVHGFTSRILGKISFRLYFRREYGQSWLRYPIFAGSDIQEFKQLILHAGGQEFPRNTANGTLLRNPIITNLSSQLDAYVSPSSPVVLFINGEPWGIYHLRERIDDQFFAAHYGIEQQTGDINHYDNLEQFIATQDLANDDNYAYVQTQMDVPNFIDYNILQLFVANTDWPQNNIDRFRGHTQGGRWHWLYWDMDFAFALAPSSSLTHNGIDRVLNGPQSWWILALFLENHDFHNTFITRTADLLNTTFRTENVIAEIDELAAAVGPNIDYEMIRWPGLGNWQASVEQLREFARRRPDIMRQHMVDAFELKGMAVFTFNPPPSGGGKVAINDFIPANLPWQGTYFTGTTVRITAIPQPGFQFAGWEPAHLPQTAAIDLPVKADLAIIPQFVASANEALQPGDVTIKDVGRESNPAPGGMTIWGDWVQLVVQRPGGVDLRGWRLTDNDTRSDTDEGSLIFGQHASLANVPQGTTIWVLATVSAINDDLYAQDDLNGRDQRMILYAGNENLDATTDPWFNLGRNDNLALLAPGPTDSFSDDEGIDFINVTGACSPNSTITPGRFGIWQDGVADTTTLRR